MADCTFCGDEAERKIPVPTDAILDKERNIVDVVFGESLEVCRECYYAFGPYSDKSKKTYSWIEGLMETPYTDGRHRITDLVLIPYLANVKEVGKKEAVEKVQMWFRVCGYTKLPESYLERQYIYVKRRGLRPLTKENFEERGLNRYKKQEVDEVA